MWVVARDMFGNIQPTPAVVQFETLDLTPPEVVAAHAVNATETTAMATVTLDEAATVYYIVMEQAVAAKREPPVSATYLVSTVQAGGGGTGSVAFGTKTVDKAYVASVWKISTGLKAVSTYVLYIVAKDTDGNIGGIRNRTFATTDTTAPTYVNGDGTATLPRVDGIIERAANLTVLLSEPGHVYYVVAVDTTGGDASKKDQLPKLTSVDVIQWNTSDATNGIAAVKGIAPIHPLTGKPAGGASGTVVRLTPLCGRTTYVAWVVGADAYGNVLPSPAVVQFKTLDLSAPSVVAAQAVNATETTAMVTATLDEAATVYYIVLPVVASAGAVAAAGGPVNSSHVIAGNYPGELDSGTVAVAATANKGGQAGAGPCGAFGRRVAASWKITGMAAVSQYVRVAKKERREHDSRRDDRREEN